MVEVDLLLRTFSTWFVKILDYLPEWVDIHRGVYFLARLEFRCEITILIHVPRNASSCVNFVVFIDIEYPGLVANIYKNISRVKSPMDHVEFVENPCQSRDLQYYFFFLTGCQLGQIKKVQLLSEDISRSVEVGFILRVYRVVQSNQYLFGPDSRQLLVNQLLKPKEFFVFARENSHQLILVSFLLIKSWLIPLVPELN